MSRKNQIIWSWSVRFLSAFRSLKYDRVPVNVLLFREFQRYCKKKYRRLPKSVIRNLSTAQLQKACLPYFKTGQPNVSGKGYTLVRADLFASTRGAKGEKFLYLAHGKKEHRRLAKVRSCRPLLYLPKMKAGRAGNRKKVLARLRRIYASPKTPRFFKTRAFRRWMNRQVRRAMRMVDKTHCLFRKYRIKQTIYGSTLNRQGALVTAFAQSRRIPTINLQHGILGTFGHLPANADLHLVWGKSHADFLKRRGTPAGKIKVVGPVFCRSMGPKSGMRLHARRSNDFRILVALQPLGKSANVRMIRAIDRAARSIGKKIRIDYKLHPDQGQGTSYRKSIRHPRSAVIPHGNIPLQHLIDAADAVITPFSTVAYEALVRRKPVLFYGRQRSPYYLKSRPLSFKTSRKLKRLLRRLLSGPRKSSAVTGKMMLKDAPGRKSGRLSNIWKAIRKFREVNAHDPEPAMGGDHSRPKGVQDAAEQKQETDEREAADQLYG